MSKFSRMRFPKIFAWNVSTLVFHPNLYFGYFCSVDICVYCIVSGPSNQSPSVFSNVIFEGFFYRCIDVIFNPDESSSLVMCRFPLIITSIARFSMPNSISISWLHILTVFFRVSNSFPLQANRLISSMQIRGLIFSYLVCLYPLLLLF